MYISKTELWFSFRAILPMICQEKCLMLSIWKRIWDNWEDSTPRWWFQIFFMFTPTWGYNPIWLIFFKWVETTNVIPTQVPYRNPGPGDIFRLNSFMYFFGGFPAPVTYKRLRIHWGWFFSDCYFYVDETSTEDFPKTSTSYPQEKPTWQCKEKTPFWRCD